ncbi:MAG: DNA polymerase III subunit delta [Bacteroidales bacterium]|nr:DNA polymerase III subunit delta [Bacteroidales bacterium]
MKFADVIGQDNVKERLRTLVAEQRMPHALLLQGREGTGALPLALALAQYIDCTGPKDNGDACGQCPACKKIQKLVHPDVHYVFPIVKLGQSDDTDTYLPQWRQLVENKPYFGLDDWTNAMTQSAQSRTSSAEANVNKQALIAKDAAATVHSKLSLKPYEAQKQILILWKPELMNEATSNSLLKILEEPPTDTLFLLVSDNPAAILPTIMSRTQVCNVPPIAEPDMVAALRDRLHLLTDEAQRLAHIAQGSYVSAIRLHEGAQNNAQYLEIFKGMMRAAWKRDVVAMNKLAEDFRALPRERVKACILYSQHLIRESFIMNLGVPKLNFLTEDEETFLTKFAPFVHVNNVEQLAELMNDTLAKVDQNANLKMVCKTMILQLTALIRNSQRPQV